MVALLTHISFSGVRVNLSLTAIDAGAPPLVIGALLSVYALVPTLFAISGGRWVDRIGVRRPLFFGIAMMIAGAAGSYLLADLRMLFATSVLVGGGFLLHQLVIQKLVGDLDPSPAARNRNFSALAIAYSLSGVVGPASTGFLVDAIGDRETFLALSALVTLIIVWLWLRRRRLPGPTAQMPVQRRFTDLLKTPELRRLYLAVGLISSAWDVHQFVVPIYGRSIGFSATQIGITLGAFGLATLIIRLVLPLLKSPNEWAAILSAQAIATVVYCVYPLSQHYYVLTGLSFVLGLGLGATQPMVLALLHRLTPPERIGEAAGLRLMVVNGSQTVLPTVFGVLGNAFGVGLLFWTLGAMIGVGAISQARGRYND
ncbi:MAG: MFS transporter [Lautropia sp.]